MVRFGTPAATGLIFWLISPLHAGFPLHFEPSAEKFNAVGARFDVQIDSRGFRLGARDGESVEMRWLGARDNAVTGENATGGHTNYYAGSDPAKWRSDVPHYRDVIAKDIYPGIDIVYRPSGAELREATVEFDLLVSAGANPGNAILDVGAAARLTAEGDLVIGKNGVFQFRRADAWQVVDGIRRHVDCAFAISRSRVHFRLGHYDRSLPLTIDPRVEYLTYLGGNGNDVIQTVALDGQGNGIVSGVSSSTNFPGISLSSPASYIFVTKISSDGSTLLYTTVLGSGTPLSNYAVLDRVTGVAADSNGNAFVTGITSHTNNFPVTAGAWQTTPTFQGQAAFLTQLDSAGHPFYSSYLGNPGWSPFPSVVRVRNGVAYVGGYISSLAFLGTAGAYQRDLHGQTDLFAMAIRPDGSAPLFVTALGGSGTEFLVDMNLDAAGNLVLAGTSTSTDFPLAAGELGYRNPSAQTSAVIARLSGDGASLLDSSYLGTTAISSAALSADRTNLIVLGNSALPADLVAKAPHSAISFTAADKLGYAAQFSMGPLMPVWTTSLPISNPSPVQTDSQGNFYFSDNSTWISGGSAFFQPGAALFKLAPDGSRLELAANVPSTAGIAVNGTGEVLVGGSAGPGLATTAGATEPNYPAKIPPTSYQTYLYTGAVMKYDASAVNGDNFFLQTLSIGNPSIAYRIGEPAPDPLALALQFNTTPFPLTFTSSNPALSASVSGDSKALDVNVNPANVGTVGTTTEHITVASASNPSLSLSFPVSFTIKPTVSFTLASNQLSVHLRVGQTYTPATIGITENFGSEFLALSASSDSSWLNTNVFHDAAHHDLLSVYISPRDPGTYHGTITVAITGLQQGKQTVAVDYIVDPAVPIQLSATTLTLHVVKGQPVQPATVNVTSAVAGVPFTLFVGVSATWLKYATQGTATPGSIQFTADSTAAVPGYYYFNFFVSGEAGQQVEGTLWVDVSSGAPLDASPASVSYTFFRNGPYQNSAQVVAVVSPSQTSVTVTSDKTWLTLNVPARVSIPTPLYLALSFDATMPEGVYQANVTVTASSGASLTIPVTYKLYDAPHLVYSPGSFTFNYQIGDPTPAVQTLTITSPTLTPGSFTAGPSGFPSFLHVDPQYGGTPATLTLTVDPTGLSPGAYKSSVYVTPGYNTQPPVTQVPVTLNVTPNPNAPASKINAITDAASYLAGSVAPGEIVVLFGSQLGPAALALAAPDPVLGFPTTLSGTTVYFDKDPAPVIYTSAGQAAVVAPFEIAGRATTSVTVSANGKASDAVVLSVASTNPAIFAANASGAGQAAAFRVTPDGTTALNNSSNPAAAGDIVSFYATGLGLTNPVQLDGSLTGTPLPPLQSAVKVLIGGRSADVLYAGPAPSLVAGAYQINARVPAGVPPGPAQLLLIAGDNPSPPGVTVAIQ